MRISWLPILVHGVPLEIIHTDVIGVIVQRSVRDHRTVDCQDIVQLNHRNVTIRNRDNATECLRCDENAIANHYDERTTSYQSDLCLLTGSTMNFWTRRCAGIDFGIAFRC